MNCYHLPTPLIVWALQQKNIPKEIIHFVLKHLQVTLPPRFDVFRVWQQGLAIPLTYSDAVGTNGDVLVYCDYLLGFTDTRGNKTVIEQDSFGNPGLNDAFEHAVGFARRRVPSNNVRRTMIVNGKEIIFFEHIT